MTHPSGYGFASVRNASYPVALLRLPGAGLLIQPGPPGYTPSGHVAFAPVQTTYKPSVVLHHVQSSGLRVKLRRTGFHILLEVPPRPKVPLTDEELLKRLGALYSKAFVATVAKKALASRD